MGFGEKKNPYNNKMINLDITYNEMIRPVLNEFNINCVRSDEIIHSGTIDTKMYKWLLDADLVIADITTLNANAMYELGIRHALKPYSTLIISDKSNTFPFDINHLSIFSYKHGGKKINNDEVLKFRNYFEKYLFNNQGEKEIDSPVFTYIDKKDIVLQHKYFSNTSTSENNEESLSKILTKAYKYMDNNEFSLAEDCFRKAYNMTSDEYILKQLAVSIYKQGDKNMTFLNKAEKTITDYGFYNTNADLLAALGAINKNKWYITEHIEFLEKSLNNYKISYEHSKEFYHGENYAFLLLLSGYVSLDKNVKIKNYLVAKDIYSEIINVILNVYDEKDFWMNATLATSYMVIDDNVNSKKYLDRKFALVNEDSWKLKTSKRQYDKVTEILPHLKTFLS